MNASSPKMKSRLTFRLGEVKTMVNYILVNSRYIIQKCKRNIRQNISQHYKITISVNFSQMYYTVMR